MSPNERFEIIGELYYRDTGYLRPGKDSREYATTAEDNQERFDQWFATRAFCSALECIERLKAGLEP